MKRAMLVTGRRLGMVGSGAAWRPRVAGKVRAKVLARNVPSQYARTRVLFVNVAALRASSEPGSTYPTLGTGGWR